MREQIYLATDHAGYPHKDAVRDWLRSEGYAVVDCGAYEYAAEDDFTDFISKAARLVSRDGTHRRAIIFGGSGQGEAILANRFPQVRAAVYYGGPQEIVELSRKHNDANVLSIGARFISIDDAKAAIWTWLHTDVLGDEKYHRRNSKIREITRTLSDFLAREV